MQYPVKDFTITDNSRSNPGNLGVIGKRPLLVILFLWSAIQLIIYLKFGVLTTLESKKYIQAANHLVSTGDLPEKRYLFYSGIISLIALSKILHTGYWLVIFLQLAFSLFSHLFFFRALKKISGNQILAPILTTGLLCICIPFQAWNFTLFSDSFFYSAILSFFSACIFLNTITAKNIGIQAILLSLVIFSRPMGILFLPCWVIFIFVSVPYKIKFSLAIFFLLALAGLYFTSNFILSGISDWQVLGPYEENQVICDLPGTHFENLAPLKNGSPVNQLWHYILQYPGEFFSLAGKKIIAFFLLSRSYYSDLHNILLWLLCIVLYVPILYNFYTNRYQAKIRSVNILAGTCIAVFILAIILQCDDYSNRFHHALIPLFLFLGLFRTLTKKVTGPN